jgi:hypothetical protein
MVWWPHPLLAHQQQPLKHKAVLYVSSAVMLVQITLSWYQVAFATAGRKYRLYSCHTTAMPKQRLG